MSLMEDLFKEVDKMISMRDMLLARMESAGNTSELIVSMHFICNSSQYQRCK